MGNNGDSDEEKYGSNSESEPEDWDPESVPPTALPVAASMGTWVRGAATGVSNFVGNLLGWSDQTPTAPLERQPPPSPAVYRPPCSVSPSNRANPYDSDSSDDGVPYRVAIPPQSHQERAPELGGQYPLALSLPERAAIQAQNYKQRTIAAIKQFHASTQRINLTSSQSRAIEKLCFGLCHAMLEYDQDKRQEVFIERFKTLYTDAKNTLDKEPHLWNRVENFLKWCARALKIAALVQYCNGGVLPVLFNYRHNKFIHVRTFFIDLAEPGAEQEPEQISFQAAH